MEITINPGDTGAFAGMTLTRGSATLDASGNGYGKGTAVDFSIDTNGTISSIFSNGVTRSVGRVALAEFVNPAGLIRAGDNVFQGSVNSGNAMVGEAGGAIDATISSGSLEQSNVDLAREFTNMILAQRGFQASAKTITTSDEVLNDLLNIRR
jgi:flagellar hook protein FlgE